MQEVLRNREFRVALMQIISKHGNIYNLINGRNYDQVLCEIRFLKKFGYVAEKRGYLLITQKGIRHIALANKKLKRKGLYKYLSCQYSCMTENIALGEVYIPNTKI